MFFHVKCGESDIAISELGGEYLKEKLISVGIRPLKCFITVLERFGESIITASYVLWINQSKQLGSHRSASEAGPWAHDKYKVMVNIPQGLYSVSLGSEKDNLVC